MCRTVDSSTEEELEVLFRVKKEQESKSEKLTDVTEVGHRATRLHTRRTGQMRSAWTLPLRKRR